MIRGRIATREDFTDRIARFTVETAEPLHFLPGQHVALLLETPDGTMECPFSLCSLPGDPALEFLGSFHGGGPLAAAFGALAPGDPIGVGEPDGELLLDQRASRHLFVATVTGVGPFLSMIRQADRSANRTPTLLLHGCRYPAELGSVGSELETFARDHDWFHYVPTVSRPEEDPSWNGETGRVVDVMRKHADRLGFIAGNCTSYVCGNPDVVAQAAGVLTRAGFPPESVRMERYLRGVVGRA